MKYLTLFFVIFACSIAKAQSKKETEDCILSKFKANSYVTYNHSKQSGKDVVTKYRDYKFSFKNERFVINYLVEEDHGRIATFREEAQVSIKDISKIIFYGNLSLKLDLIGHDIQSFNITNLKTGTVTTHNTFNLNFRVKNDLDYDIGNRLSKAFSHLQNLRIKPEPF